VQCYVFPLDPVLIKLTTEIAKVCCDDRLLLARSANFFKLGFLVVSRKNISGKAVKPPACCALSPTLGLVTPLREM